MACGDSNRSVRVWQGQYLSQSAPGLVNEIVSAPVAMRGNKVALLAEVTNISGTTPEIEFELQGSYNGTVWDIVVAAVPADAFGAVTTSQGSVAYAFIRVAARISSGSSVKAVFDVTLAFSAQ